MNDRSRSKFKIVHKRDICIEKLTLVFTLRQRRAPSGQQPRRLLPPWAKAATLMTEMNGDSRSMESQHGRTT
jgi:hypothetical protein